MEEGREALPVVLQESEFDSERAGEPLRLGVVTGATGRTQVTTGSLRLQCREWPLGDEGHRGQVSSCCSGRSNEPGRSAAELLLGLMPVPLSNMNGLPCSG